uniref:Lig_chan-Glu_bd domain-containing protein n=1 Tax=Trichuris muris TaxID=70415 RepID=A0A5S6QKS4_TRIMR
MKYKFLLQLDFLVYESRSAGNSIIFLPFRRNLFSKTYNCAEDCFSTLLRFLLICNGLLMDDSLTVAGASHEETTFKIATFQQWPYVYTSNRSDLTLKPENEWTGIVWDILSEIGKSLNIKYELVNHSFHSIGEFRDGEWTALVGLLQRKEVDLVAAAIDIRPDRLSVMDYSTPLFESDHGVLIRSPDVFTDNTFVILTAVFSRTAWLMLAAYVVASGLIFYGLCKVLKGREEMRCSVVDACWVFFSILLQQGLTTLPKSFTCRMMVAIWWLMSVTLFALFSGHMLIALSSDTVKYPFYTLDELVDLVEYSGYTVITKNSTVTTISLIQMAFQKSLQRLWREMKVNRKWINVTSFEKGKNLVVNNPNMVFISQREPLHILSARDCQVTLAPVALLPLWYAIGYRKGFPLAQLFSERITWFIETGYVQKSRQDYRNAMAAKLINSACYVQLHKGYETPLNLDELQVFLLEYVCKKLVALKDRLQ